MPPTNPRERTKLEFPSWKASVASHLKSHSVWKDLVVSVSPPVFIPSPVPTHMEAADSSLFAAMKYRMDPDAKKMIPVDITSGIELMEALTAACSPTLSEMTVI